ncbi:MAG TPA: S46 family peptidase, partial [Bryobacteraceae bacterium]|nr:S46 family peptidase [Bryobacteraceae bacterium]
MRLTCAALAFVAASSLLADEGLWPYNQFPRDALRQKNGFDTPDGFLDHLRGAAVRLGGGSGSFVSANGLILTSRQATAACNLSIAGFLAGENGTELRCPGL